MAGSGRKRTWRARCREVASVTPCSAETTTSSRTPGSSATRLAMNRAACGSPRTGQHRASDLDDRDSDSWRGRRDHASASSARKTRVLASGSGRERGRRAFDARPVARVSQDTIASPGHRECRGASFAPPTRHARQAGRRCRRLEAEPTQTSRARATPSCGASTRPGRAAAGDSGNADGDAASSTSSSIVTAVTSGPAPGPVKHIWLPATARRQRPLAGLMHSRERMPSGTNAGPANAAIGVAPPACAMPSARDHRFQRSAELARARRDRPT